LKELIEKPSIPQDEGLWVVPSKGLHTVSMRMANPMDLLYLDGDYQVIQAVESSPKLHLAPPRMVAASVLALPAHTIYSSQTQPGNQLVICAAEALEFRLKGAAESELPLEMPLLGTGNDHSNRVVILPAPENFHDRRRAPRQLNPRLVAYDWNGDNLAVHGIRDASTTGLFLLTEKRWPLGTMVVMTLQKQNTAEEKSGPSIAVQLEVVRCGADGVGLQFVSPGVLESTQWIAAEHVHDGAR
jgi:uncharacterized membrane protein (UPF0127 family)